MLVTQSYFNTINKNVRIKAHSLFSNFILKGFAHRMSKFISEVIFVFISTCFTFITLAASDCLITIGVSDTVFTIPKSVVFHIQPILSESIKLPQDHFVKFLLIKYIWYE